MKTHPHINFLGVQDASVTAPEITDETFAQHIPLFFGWKAWGDNKAAFLDGPSFLKKHHGKTLDVRGKFATHATPFINGALGSPSVICFKPLRANGAAKAGLTIALDILETKVPEYEIDDNGFFIYDGEGNTVPTGNENDGLLIIPMVIAVDEATMRDGTPVDGIQSKNGVTSKIYKLMTFPASYEGSLGNGIGVKISSPTTKSTNPIDLTEAMAQRAYMHRIEFVLRETNSPNIWKTIASANRIDFTFKQDTVHSQFSNDLFLADRYMNEYVDPDTDTNGPVSEIITFNDNILEVLEKMQQVESAINPTVSSAAEDVWMMNLLGGHDYEKRPYRTIFWGDSLDNYPEFTSINTHYLVGGADGDTSPEAYELAVANELANFGMLDDRFRDIARFPFSSIYDSGFTTKTKDTFGFALSGRPDVDVVMCPFVANVNKPSVAEEISASIAIKTKLRLHPESIEYGTATCRATIFSGSARILNSEWKRSVPTTYELLMKRCVFLGSGDGFRKLENDYTQYPNNEIKFLRNSDFEDTWLLDEVRQKQWGAGINTIHSSGTKTNFMPAIVTISDSDDSTLKSEKTTFITSVCKRVAFKVWVSLVGNDDLTEAQFIQRSNERIADLVKGRFGVNTRIEPETYFDKSTTTWNTKIHVYTSKQRRANNVTIVTHDLATLLNAAN